VDTMRDTVWLGTEGSGVSAGVGREGMRGRGAGFEGMRCWRADKA